MVATSASKVMIWTPDFVPKLGAAGAIPSLSVYSGDLVGGKLILR